MADETPRFNCPETEQPDSTFYSLLLNSCLKKNELEFEHIHQRNLTPFTKFLIRKKNLSPVRKRERNNVSEPKGQSETFLENRFKLKNGYDEEFVDEFLLSKEEAFEFPSKDSDIID